MATNTVKSVAQASNVYLFKNGYGMIVKTFEFPPKSESDEKNLELINLPSNAVHGTFWIQPTSENVSVHSIRTKKTHTFIEKDCRTIEDLLEANIGENVHLNVVNDFSKTTEWISGKIKSIKRAQQVSEDDGNSNSSAPSSSFGQSTIVAGSGTLSHVFPGNLLIFETTDDGIMAIPHSNVKSIRGPQLKTTYQKKVFTNGLSIEYQSRSGSNELGLMKYLTHGLTWVPSYDIVMLLSNVSAEKKLHLSSKAVILNDIETIDVKNLFCIVGFPNVTKFASVIDPIVSNDNVTTFLNRLNQAENSVTNARHNISSVMSNSIMTQQIMAPSHIDMSNSNADQSNSDTDDLHLYDFRNVRLEKKERLVLPIFDLDIPYKDIYHCDINQLQLDHFHSGHGEKKDFEEVWHSIEFKNQSEFVWTTAPVVITKGLQEQQFIGQDKITYTMKGSTAMVKLTKALDVRVQAEENVVNTNTTRITFYRNHYQTDTIDGKISIANHKNEDINVVLSIKLFGKIVSCSLAPKKDMNKTNRDLANQHHDIQWEVPVKAKQAFEIKYTRQFNRPV